MHSPLSVRSFSAASSLLWGAAVLLVGLINLWSPGYGTAFLDLVRSVYPGYHADPHLSSVIIGTLYALLDGAVAGALFAWIYNGVLKRITK